MLERLSQATALSLESCTAKANPVTQLLLEGGDDRSNVSDTVWFSNGLPAGAGAEAHL